MKSRIAWKLVVDVADFEICINLQGGEFDVNIR